MRKQFILTSASAFLLTTALVAQTVQTVPAGLLTTEGNSSTSYPWNTSTVRVQMCYDSTHITSSGPVLIQRLRWRANGSTTGTWTGRTYGTCIVKLSSSKNDWASLANTAAGNEGADVKTVYSGTATVAPQATAGGSPNAWYVDIKLTTPFLYDPSQGKDLLIDVGATGVTGGTSYSVDGASGTTYKCSRQYSLSSATDASLPSGNSSFAPVIEITWVPAKGLYTDFSASPTSGSGPLKVQFKDTTYTSSAGGVKTWAWDFDGDSKIDSNAQNPSWTYPSIAKTAQYSVTLTTTDGVNPASKKTKTNLITVDPKPVADFSATPRTGAVGGPSPVLLVKFTDLTVGANKWAWDFDGDSKVDSTVQNPTWAVTKPGKYSPTLSVSGVGGTDKITKTDYIEVLPSPSLTVNLEKNNGLSSTTGYPGNMFDMEVKAATGLTITHLSFIPYNSMTTPVTVELWTRPTTHVGFESSSTGWTLRGEGTVASVTGQALTYVDISDATLPTGKYGVAIMWTKGAGVRYTTGTATNVKVSNNDLAIDASNGRGFNGSTKWPTSWNTPRIWNGIIHYIVPGWSSYGLYGEGCKGNSSNLPTLAPAANSLPKLGSTLMVDLGNMPAGGGSAIMLTGLSRTKLFGAVPLPISMAPFGAPGCNLITDVLFMTTVTNTAGKGTFSLPIPNNTKFIGAYLSQQAIVADATANKFGFTFTNGGEMHVGK